MGIWTTPIKGILSCQPRVTVRHVLFTKLSGIDRLCINPIRSDLSIRVSFKRVYKLMLTTAGEWDCSAAVERLLALHYSVDFIFLSFGIMGFIVELWNY